MAITMFLIEKDAPPLPAFALLQIYKLTSAWKFDFSEKSNFWDQYYYINSQQRKSCASPHMERHAAHSKSAEPGEALFWGAIVFRLPSCASVCANLLELFVSGATH